jgi:hypothetical protein
MSLPAEIDGLCQAFLAGLNQALGPKLLGVYLYGALTFPDPGPLSDLDFHVILHAPLDSREKSQIQALHTALAQDFPPLGAELDGYYILLEDARRVSPPPDQLRPNLQDLSWALECAHIRSGHYLILLGPDPLQIYPEVTWPALELALAGELDFVEQNLRRYPAFSVLNLCRLVYSYRTHEVVVSKRFSARWASSEFPGWVSLIEAAKNRYDRNDTVADDFMLNSNVAQFYAFACGQIEQSKLAYGPSNPGENDV